MSTAASPGFPGGVDAFEKLNCDGVHGLMALFDANMATFVNRQKLASDYPPFIAYIDHVVAHLRVFERAANELSATGRPTLHNLVQLQISSLSDVKNRLQDMQANATQIAAQMHADTDAKIRKVLADAAEYERKVRAEVFENQRAAVEHAQAAWRSYQDEAKKNPIPIYDHTIKIWVKK